MVSMWKPCGVHMETMWFSHGNHVVSTFEPMCCLPGNHMLCTWKPHGVHVPCRNHVVFMLTQHGYHIDTTWFPGGYHMVCMWTACGFHVDTMWFPCGPHVVSRWIPHHFQITSVANWSRKLINLWKPVTSLIMVRFSNRKKFWKAAIMPFACGEMTIHGETTTSFSFWPNLTAKSCDHLSEPIRRLHSLKSPSSRQNLWDFMRFHPKFHSHLKSKAVRTALLKSSCTYS